MDCAAEDKTLYLEHILLLAHTNSPVAIFIDVCAASSIKTHFSFADSF